MYKQVWYSTFYMHQYERLPLLMYVKQTMPYLYIQPSSCRRTLGFETCRRHQI